MSNLICYAVKYLLFRSFKKSSDVLLKAEASQWLFDSITSFSVLILLIFAHLMISNQKFMQVVTYIDLLLVIILGMYLSKTPIKLIILQIKVLLETAPNDLIMKQLNVLVKRVNKKYGFKELFIRTSEGNQSIVLEIEFVVSKKSNDRWLFNKMRFVNTLPNQ